MNTKVFGIADTNGRLTSFVMTAAQVSAYICGAALLDEQLWM